MISILIPTLNRYNFLIRALHYYTKVGFKGYVCIGDSSNAQHVEKTKRAIQTLGNKIKIIYRYYPNPPYIHDGMVIKELVELAPTPYAVYAGDDDFVIPNGLEQCITFLKDHPEYSATHGIRVSIRLKSSGAFGELASARYVPQPRLESAKALERWIQYRRYGISSQYSVHRIETWRRMYRDVASIPIRYFGPELLPCSISSILGKTKELDCLSIVFQENDKRFFDFNKQSMYFLITHPNWSQSVKILRDCIVEALIQQDGTDAKRAQEIFDKELWRFIFSTLQRQYCNKYGELTSWNAIKETLKRIPGLVALVRRLKQQKIDEYGLNHKYRNQLSLDSLLSPLSPFYDDFVVVYRNILNPSELNLQIK